MNNKTVVVSGGFDPIHVGHIRLIQAAAQMGRLVVLLNTDEWLLRKKGYIFMPQEERKEILEAIAGVSEVVIVIDQDDSVSQTIELIHPDIYATGGDVTPGKVRERETCQRLGIQVLYNVVNHPGHSSDYVTRACLACSPWNVERQYAVCKD